MRKYTIVTVVFEGDVELMLLQARSMRLYCDPGSFEEIIVVNNFSNEEAKPKRWHERLAEEYGTLFSKVRIIEATTVADTHGHKGWWSQQVLKLAIANLVKTDRYLILDAKNHLVKSLTREFLEAPDGRVKINGYGYDSHPLRHFLESTCAYVGIDPAGPLRKFVRTSTPFTMVTSAAKAMVKNIECMENADLADVMTKHGLTEFFLYAATLEKAGVLHELYDWSQLFSPDIWAWGAEDMNIIREAIEKTTRDSAGPFFGLHRGAVHKFAPDARYAISDFWVSRGLFSDREAAFDFLSNMR